jgi:hypothetical protein
VKGIHLRLGVSAAATLLVAGAAALALPAPLEAQGPAERAAVSLYPSGVEFRPLVSSRGATLTVAGNGLTFEQAFERGERPSIGMFDAEGEPLPDGTYTWRLSLLPDAATARALRDAASRGEGLAGARWLAQTGTFTIRNGSIVDPGLREAQPSRLEGADPGSELHSDMGGMSSVAGAFAQDTDDVVGNRPGVEEQMRAANELQTATVSVGGLQQLAGSHFERTDVTTLALGRSAEAPSTRHDRATTQASGAPSPRPAASANGANGRSPEGQ